MVPDGSTLTAQPPYGGQRRSAAMRGIECVIPGCAHIHAEDDERLIQEVLRHARDVHPDARFTEDQAREMVRTSAADDPDHK
jgi:hypothetical protein